MVSDGASIPRIFWIAYPPLDGKYRLGAVIHDYYCDTKTRTWKDTHRVFYDALKTSEVDEITAKGMYAAVYNFGRRWGPGVASRGPGGMKAMTLEQEETAMNDIKSWIKKENPSLEQIEQRLENEQ